MNTLSGRARALAAVVAIATACGVAGDRASRGPTEEAEPGAGRWSTWVLESPDEIYVPPPPAAGSEAAEKDRRELRASIAERTPEMLEVVRNWDQAPSVKPWIELAMELVASRPKDPPGASRAYGYVSVAMYDAIVAAYHHKYLYNRKAPSGIRRMVPVESNPSYPSEHATVAGAASRVLAHLFPEQPAQRFEALAAESGRTRVIAGVNFPSDVEAGLALGRKVAAKVIARAKRDGFDLKWDGSRPRGKAYWAPPPGSTARPVQPRAGDWDTWVMSSGDQFRPPPPPKLGTPAFRREAEAVMEVAENLTEEQKLIAKFWEGGEGTPLPPGIWNQVAMAYVRRDMLSGPLAARAFALINVAMADAGVAAWDAKYEYWYPRPENGIRDAGLDRHWKPYLPTPFFPAYVSGHATYSGAVGEVMAYLFPGSAGRWRAKAEEAAMSRVYGGIHWPVDGEEGLRMGRQIGRLVVQRAQTDGADR